MKVLLTNDDSHSSLLLHFIINYLKDKVDLTVVVPEYEQSWQGKAISRFAQLKKRVTEIEGYEVVTISGSPADCANIGIHHICPSPPDVVISGINLGRNTGLGFILSSGTVGACFEANIAGIPGVALSQSIEWKMMQAVAGGNALETVQGRRLVQQAERILDDLLPKVERWLVKSTTPQTANVNFPFVLREPIEFVLTSAAHNFYGSLFSSDESESSFAHDLRVISRDPRRLVDSEVIEAGAVSVTPIDIRLFAQLGQESSGWD